MQPTINNLCKRPWGWEGYIDWANTIFEGTPPTEFRLPQESQPTDEQIKAIIEYHIERLTNIANQENQ
jgi:hypothetical protein